MLRLRLRSSGSPCFNEYLELIGLHFARDTKDRCYGTSIDAIMADLGMKGLAGLLGAKLA